MHGRYTMEEAAACYSAPVGLGEAFVNFKGITSINVYVESPVF